LNRRLKNLVQKKWMEKLKIKTLFMDGGFLIKEINIVKIPLMDKKEQHHNSFAAGLNNVVRMVQLKGQF
jgi:hypothetical protein